MKIQKKYVRTLYCSQVNRHNNYIILLMHHYKRNKI